jgi:CubicO group peptidase (beta-lactamase class C family)
MPDPFVASAFQRVADVFESDVMPNEDGAAFAAYVAGELVVDLWDGPGWERDTLCGMYSSAKGLAAICVQILAERGELVVDLPMRAYWPEFADERVLVRHVLTHTSGIVAIPSYQTLRNGMADTEEIVHRLASATPEWEPGTAIGYHAVTYGYLVGELVRRVAGMSLGTFLRREFPEHDVWIGLPASEHHRVIDYVTVASDIPSPIAALLSEDTLVGRSLMAAGDPQMWMRMSADFMNSPLGRTCEVPSSNGIATARGLAGAYLPIALGELPKTTPRFTSVQAEGASALSGEPMRMGFGYGILPRGVGHGGLGGSIGYCDPESRLTAGFLRNRIGHNGPGADVLIAAVYDCLR